MLVSLEEKDLKKLINKAILGVLSELVVVADREGFEPSVRSPRRTLSRGVVSATQPSVQVKIIVQV